MTMVSDDDDDEGYVLVNVAHTSKNAKASLDMWHRRLRHMNVDYVMHMVQKGMVDGMSVTPDSKKSDKPCEACLRGKQT